MHRRGLWRHPSFLRACACAATIAHGTVSVASAQLPTWPREPYLRPAIYGRIVDSLTQAPVGGVGIRVRGQTGLSTTDSLGRYLRFAMPLGTRELLFLCPSRRRWWGRQFASRLVDVAARTDSAVDFHLPLAGCGEPPETSVRVELRGRYTSGFESSAFEPCRPFPDLVGTAYEGLRRSVWVEFAPGALERAPAWPRPPGELYPEVFVRWRGTLTGPGSYGHLGSGLYRLLVEEVLEVRTTAARDCH